MLASCFIYVPLIVFRTCRLIPLPSVHLPTFSQTE
jgi:hypothetical protein